MIKTVLLIIGIVFGTIFQTVSQTDSSENILKEERIHCFTEDEYQGILDMFYEIRSLNDQVDELHRVLGIKDNALDICVGDYNRMEESLIIVKDSISSYKIKINDINDSYIKMENRYRNTKIWAISATGAVIVAILISVL